MSPQLRRAALLVGAFAACGYARPDPVASGRLASEEVATLASLRQVDDHPLYTLRYHGSYGDRAVARLASARPTWACSLIAGLGESTNLIYGRNFDWDYSPAVLVFTSPPDAYASVSMVDIAYLGFAGAGPRSLTERSLAERAPLLDAPLIPFDGMNEHGLVVGMAAVPASEAPRDPGKPRIGSLRLIRELLDRARDVVEALDVMRRYNLDWGPGPPLHYLIADASGRAMLVEFHHGRMVAKHNDQPWHLATNHLRATAEGDGGCLRYARIRAKLAAARGRLTAEAAMSLLADVSQPSTQWSVVYGISSGRVEVVMGQRYETRHFFRMENKP